MALGMLFSSDATSMFRIDQKEPDCGSPFIWNLDVYVYIVLQ